MSPKFKFVNRFVAINLLAAIIGLAAYTDSEGLNMALSSVVWFVCLYWVAMARFGVGLVFRQKSGVILGFLLKIMIICSFFQSLSSDQVYFAIQVAGSFLGVFAGALLLKTLQSRYEPLDV